MSTLRQFHFYSSDRREPFIRTLYDYQLSKDGKEGHIHFNGYYYVLDEEFPRRVYIITTLREDTPIEEETTDSYSMCSYRHLEEKFYSIEIYRREKIRNTSEYGDIEEDGQQMRVCFFPTDEQKIYFRVLKEFNSFQDFLRESSSEEGAQK